MSDQETKRFKLTLKQIPDIELETPEGDVIPCVIQELTGKLRDTYLNKLGKRVDPAGGDTRVKDFEGLHADLLVRSLLKVTTEGLIPFTVDEIQEFPAPVQAELFKMSKELSRLEEDEDKEGND